MAHDDFFDDDELEDVPSTPNSTDDGEDRLPVDGASSVARAGKGAGGASIDVAGDTGQDRNQLEADAAAGDAVRAPRQGPSFAVVVAIAIVSLLLGIVIGFAIASSASTATGTSVGVANTNTTNSSTSNDSTTSSTTDTTLPEGHPSVSEETTNDASTSNATSD